MLLVCSKSKFRLKGVEPLVILHNFKYFRYALPLVYQCCDLIIIFFTAPSAPPEGLVITEIRSTSVTLRWSPPPASQQNGIIREYQVNITEIQTANTILLNSTSTSVVVQSLHPHYMYACAVSAYTVGSGPYSEVLNVTTAEDGTLYERGLFSDYHTLVFYSPFIKHVLEMAKGSVIARSEYEPTYKFL